MGFATTLEAFCAKATPEWVRANFEGFAAFDGDVVVAPAEGCGGLNCAVFTLELRPKSAAAADADANASPLEEPKRFFVKALLKTTEESSPAKLQQSVQLGCPREAVFYNKMRGERHSFSPMLVPTVHAEGDLATGEKIVVLEMVEGHAGGHLIEYDEANRTRGHPLLTPQKTAEERAALRKQVGKTQLEFCTEAFVAAARLHGEYWGDDVTARQWTFLRARQWLGPDAQPAEPKEFADAVAMARNGLAWIEANVLAAGAPKAGALQLEPHLVAALRHSFSKASYAGYAAGLGCGWTVVHGDFWANNFLCEAGGRTRLVDFEMVGLGSGPQELGQFMVSNPEPAWRRSVEQQLVRDVYHAELAKVLRPGATLPSADAVWREYQAGGAGRWLWFVAVLSTFGLPGDLMQYLADQTAAFVADHFPDVEAVPMPRV